jgi:hypothetical protein
MATHVDTAVPVPQHGRWSALVVLGACCLLGVVIAVGGTPAALAALGLVAVLAGVLWVPYVVIGLLALYLPFESVIIYRLPPSAYVAAKHGLTALSGLLALGLLVRTLALRLMGREQKRFLPPAPGTLPFVFFAFWVFLSAAANGCETLWPVKMLVQEARFFPLFFAIVLAAPSRKTVKRLLIVLFIAAGIQALLGLAQIVAGDPVGQALALPEVQSEEVTYATGSNPNTTSAGRIPPPGATTPSACSSRSSSSSSPRSSRSGGNRSAPLRTWFSTESYSSASCWWFSPTRA